MRVASNKLQDMIAFYHSELRGVYDENEIDALLGMAMEHFLGYSPAQVITRSGNNINQSVLVKLYDCCKDLKKHLPIQYILNVAWFYRLKFRVNKQVLIPRPETEELVDLILRENKMPLSFLDIGTGSGCIPVALKKFSGASNVAACDISEEALAIAVDNAATNNCEVTFFKADILNTAGFQNSFRETVDVIVSNPPYIKFSEKESLDKHVVDQEPHLALFVEGDDPVIFYKKIIALCKTTLKPKGKLYFELNPLTAEEVRIAAMASGLFEETILLKDMSGNIRFLKAIKF
jgi:release factor glutamine methyltransferase